MIYNLHVAESLSLLSALISHNIMHRIKYNEDRKRGYAEGKYWMTQSILEMAILFDVTPRRIQYALNKLIREGYIVSGCFNKNKSNMTRWYSATDKLKQVYETYPLNTSNSIEQSELKPKIPIFDECMYQIDIEKAERPHGASFNKNLDVQNPRQNAACHPVSSHDEKTKLLNGYIINKYNNYQDYINSALCIRHTYKRQEYTPEFEAWWQTYPTKRNKINSFKIWKGKGLDAHSQRLIEHTRMMRENDHYWPQGIVQYPDTYLATERYLEDYRKPPVKFPKSKPKNTQKPLWQTQAHPMKNQEFFKAEPSNLVKQTKTLLGDDLSKDRMEGIMSRFTCEEGALLSRFLAIRRRTDAPEAFKAFLKSQETVDKAQILFKKYQQYCQEAQL